MLSFWRKLCNAHAVLLVKLFIEFSAYIPKIYNAKNAHVLVAFLDHIICKYILYFE